MIKQYTAFYYRDYIYIKELDQVFQIDGLGDWILLDKNEFPAIFKAVKKEFEQQGVLQ